MVLCIYKSIHKVLNAFTLYNLIYSRCLLSLFCNILSPNFMYKKFIGIIFIISIIACNNTNDSTFVSSPKVFSYLNLKNTKGLDIDSLYHIVSLQPSDTLKVEQLLSIYQLSIRNKPIRTDILNKALKLSEELNYNTGIAKSLKNKGLNSRYKHEYIKSIKYHKEAIKYFEKSWDINSKIKNLNSLGVAYRRINVEDEAIKYYFKALDISKEEDHPKSIAIAMNGIGNAYVTLKKYDYAIKYFKLSLKYELLCNSIKGASYDYNNLGEVFMYKEQYDSSLFYHNKALKVANKLNTERDKAIKYSSIGRMYQHKGDLDIALRYYLDAIPVLAKKNDKRSLSLSLINTGKIYLEKGEFKNAEKYIIEGLNLSKSISTKDNIVSGYEALSALKEVNGDYKSALAEYKNMVIYRDSIFNIYSHYNIVAMDIKYESELKDEKIIQLNLESEVHKGKIAIQFLAIAVLGMLALFFVFYNRIRIKNQILEIRNMRLKIDDYLKHISKLEDNDNEYLTQINYRIKIEEYGLSAREEEVLDLIAQGLKNPEIANKMFVSLSTINKHTKNIFVKLDVRNRIEASKKINSL